jgi:hypothetical protein
MSHMTPKFQWMQKNLTYLNTLRQHPMMSREVFLVLSKTILEEKRQNFLVENIERYLVIYCNK